MIVTVETEYAKLKLKGSVDEIVEALKRMGLNFDKLQKVKVKMERQIFKDKADTG